ncbi:chloride channel protein [Desulfacinum hydrothermale]|uniref:chloride channel protein n=1 Tax=Desulfacinum hydrothermale TaxID=109258 RepID=UPI001FE87AF4|nr:chloride channel protein [Desulfacinum hydrothermale]
MIQATIIRDALDRHKTLRWVVYSLIIGVVSGLGACAFFFLLEWGKYFCLEYLAGYSVAKPAGEQLVHLEPAATFRRWALLLLPTVGGLLSGWIVYTWAPEAEGHGTDALIDAFHNKQGIVRTRVPYIKSVASIITLATGGSAGREGPIAQIGAGFGSWVARTLNMTVRERRLMLLAGCAAGLGAIFRAPLGGALTAIEVLYREDFETEGIVLCIMSSVVANALFTSIFGHQPIFETPQITFVQPVELLFYAALGLVCVPFGCAYVKIFYGMRDYFFRRLPLKKAHITALGGLMVGLLGLWHPEVLCGGYGIIQKALLGQMPITFMLVLAILKIFATSFTISSGGSGGVFGPSLFIGAMLGGVVGQISHQYYPELVTNPGAFALVGMGAFFAGVAKAPIGALLMVCEMTGGYALVPPLMFSSVIAVLLSGGWGLYEKQVLNKFHSPAHRADAVINVLQTLKVNDIYRRQAPVTSLPEDMTFANFKRLLVRTRESFFPVVDDSFRLKGILSLPDLRSIFFEDSLAELLVVGELASPPVSVDIEDSLYDALIKFLKSGYGRIPIEDPQTGVVGVLRLEELMEAYHKEIQRLKED